MEARGEENTKWCHTF